MRKFLIKYIRFFILLLVVAFIGVIGHYFILNDSDYWKLPKSTKHLILGHSHPARAFNDNRIPALINLGKEGEAYFYTYIKARMLLKSNRNIKNVLIEFEPGNAKRTINQWTWGNDQLKHHFPRYFPIIEMSEFYFLWKKNKRAILSCLPRRYMEEIGYSFLSKFVIGNGIFSNNRFGGYLPTDKSRLDSIIDSEKMNYQKNRIDSTEISKANLAYLRKTIDLFKQNQIEVFLLRSPVHSSRAPIFKNFKKLKSETFSDVEYLDFAYFPIENEGFLNPGHLNSKGANLFSDWFAELLKKGLLKKADKQALIDREIKALSNPK